MLLFILNFNPTRTTQIMKINRTIPKRLIAQWMTLSYMMTIPAIAMIIDDIIEALLLVQSGELNPRALSRYVRHHKAFDGSHAESDHLRNFLRVCGDLTIRVGRGYLANGLGDRRTAIQDQLEKSEYFYIAFVMVKPLGRRLRQTTSYWDGIEFTVSRAGDLQEYLGHLHAVTQTIK